MFSHTIHATGVIVMDGVVNVIDDCGIVILLCGHCFFVVFQFSSGAETIWIMS